MAKTPMRSWYFRSRLDKEVTLTVKTTQNSTMKDAQHKLVDAEVDLDEWELYAVKDRG